MSAPVTPIDVRGTATLSNIALRASSNVPPRHRPDKRAEACRWLAESLRKELDEIERRLDALEAKRRDEAQKRTADQSDPNSATSAQE